MRLCPPLDSAKRETSVSNFGLHASSSLPRLLQPEAFSGPIRRGRCACATLLILILHAGSPETASWELFRLNFLSNLISQEQRRSAACHDDGREVFRDHQEGCVLALAVAVCCVVRHTSPDIA